MAVAHRSPFHGPRPMSDVTRILSQIESGDPQAAEKLLPLVYDELRKLAAVKLAQEKPGQTLQATALVHEAYLRLVGGGEWQDQLGQPRAISLRRRPRRCGGFWSRTPAAKQRGRSDGGKLAPRRAGRAAISLCRHAAARAAGPG